MDEETHDSGKDKKPHDQKRINVRILRAVDNYHNRNATINVPNDEYHKGLLKQGSLVKVDG